MTGIGVVHGRFQVFHNDHLRYVLAARERCDFLMVGVTNPDPSLTLGDDADPGRSMRVNNPLTYYERLLLVRAALEGEGLGSDDFEVVPFPVSFPNLYEYYVPLDATFFITIYDDWGRRKKAMFQERGLKVEVLWDRPAGEKNVKGRELRALMAGGGDWASLVPEACVPLIKAWDVPGRLKRMLGG